MKRAALAAVAGLAALATARAAPAPVPVAPADAFHADVARNVGGDAVAVGRPGAPAPAGAIRFGAGGFDDWLDVEAMRAGAAALSNELAKRRPDAKLSLALRLKAFDDGLKPVRAELARLSANYVGEFVVAADAHARAFFAKLGAPLKAELVDADAFAKAPPGGPDAKTLAGVAQDLQGGAANLFFYDVEAASPAIKAFAKKVAGEGAVVVALRHTLPAKLDWQGFLLRELRATRGAFNEAAQ
ncbi:MAG: hypothetical protein KGI57_04980 [Hyphomicrobiales bacterium]|nr:hypothetical protein [Hyphomicrobiales bacterium]